MRSTHVESSLIEATGGSMLRNACCRRSARRCAALLLSVLCASAPWAHAGLSGPPPSFVTPTSDGRAVFVMLSSVPLQDDEGRFAKLPGGETVDLRSHFPSSGLYPLHSNEPRWTVDWYGEEGYLHLSEDGRFVVRLNRFGGGGYGQGIKPTWGVKFYDRGQEIASHDVAELVDYPSLMPFTTWDWHHYWLGESELRGENLALSTSTHEEFSFDVTTGRIFREKHRWRNVARGLPFVGGALLSVVALLGVRGLRRQRTQGERCAVAIVPAQLRTGGRFVFSLRQMLVTVAAIGVGLAFARYDPELFTTVCLIGAFLIPAPILTAWLFFDIRRNGWTQSCARRKRVGHLAMGVMAWLWFYLGSGLAAPIVADEMNWPEDVRRALMLGPYRPIVWLEHLIHHVWRSIS
jgi:hypothetical protein